ncbi:hypothetical protein ACFE04_026929 [Oxalis oulophora]
MDSIDPRTGFCSKTKTFHTLRPHVPLPPRDQPLSIAQYIFSKLRTAIKDPSFAINSYDTVFLTDASTGAHLTFSTLLRHVTSLALSLQHHYALKPNDVAFILCPTSLNLPIVYFALLSLGLTVNPSNPLCSDSELTHQLSLTRPAIAFVTKQTAHKLPSSLPKVIIDSSEFNSFLTQHQDVNIDSVLNRVTVSQSDTAAILFSSGTTGRVKGVALTHENLIALICGLYHNRAPNLDPDVIPQPVTLLPIPLFHVFGFFMLVRGVATGETLVLMERFDFEGMLKAIEKYKVRGMPVSPPLIVALVKSDLTKKYDLSSLFGLGSGGAPLGKEVADKFKEKFPDVALSQGYGMTETAGAVTRAIGPNEAERLGSVGRLSENLEAKIVDPVTGEALGPGQKGELWLRGALIMKGYVGDEKATAETLDSEGWLKTGDLCYFDSDGFLYIVDRLKELIKYKAYQVPPAELEKLLQSHPEIADAAVIPYPDEEAGQIPMAYVVRKPGSQITQAQIMEYIAKQVAPYKKIRRVAFINAIPKSPAGKILRRELTNQSLSSSRL